MTEATTGKRSVTEKYGLQLAAVLLLYACYHAVAEHAFFDGFLNLFSWLNKTVFGAANAPALLANVPYHSSSILLSALSNPYFSLSLLLFYIPLVIRRKQLKEVGFDKPSRIVIFVAAIVLAWELSTYDYNYYLGHAFYFDRILLLVLAISLLRYPLLSPLFLALAFVYRSQFNYPVAGFPLFDKRVLFDVQVMFMAHTYVRLFIPSFKVHFLYFMLCMVGANYFMTGIKKLSMQPHIYGWIAKNDPGDLFTNVHYRGWLANTSDETISAIAATLSKFKAVLQLIVLLIELSGLFLLRSRKMAIVFLFCFGLMHLGIFLLGSMLFWKWMALDITLACLLIYSSRYLKEELFTKQGFMASLIIIPLSGLWLQPMMIGWYDTPVNQYFTYEVVSPTGQVYELDKNEMNPYHQWYEYDNFLFLVNQPVLRITGFGYTNKYETVSAIRQAGPAGFKRLETAVGKNVYDPIKKEQYDAFIKTYFMNRNKMLDMHFIPSYLRAPNHLYSYSKTGGYRNKAVVQHFRVIFNQVYTQGGKKIVQDRRLVDDIFIPN